MHYFRQIVSKLALITALAFAGVTLFGGHTAFAQYINDAPAQSDQLCQLPLTNLAPHYKIGSSYIKTEFVNRSEIKISFQPDGFKCQSDKPNIQFIIGNYDITPYVDATYTDKDTTDSNFNYIGGEHGSQVSGFTTFGDLASNSGGHIASYSDSDLTKFATSAELKIKGDETKFGNLCPRDNRASFGSADYEIFFDANSGSGSWRCRNADDFGFTGIKLIDTVPDILTLRKFNITMTYTPGSDTFDPIDSKNAANFTFTRCKNAGADALIYGVKSCAGNLFVNGKSYDAATIGDASQIYKVFDTADNAVKNGSAGLKFNITVAGGSSPSATGKAGAAGGAGTPSLQCNAGYNPLNWLLCAAVNGMVSIVSSLDRLINSQLSIGSDGVSDDPSQVFGFSGNDGQYSTGKAQQPHTSQNAYYKAWQGMRNIALGLMVVAGLIVILAQAFGTELVDAYTFRKILPRILIAAFAITLSWQLLQFFVKLTNDLGFGVKSLILQPFVDNLQTTATGGTGGTTAASILGFGALAALGIFGLLSFAATAALAVFIGFILLVLRQIVVIVLIIFAPIAIVAYILPNTQKVYKVWWESLSKALLMFPIIAAFIAVGRVFSLVSIQPHTLADGTTSQPTAVNQFIGFAAYFAPYFLLPLAFKLAGGTLSRLSGAVNDRSRGGFDRLKKFRQNTTARRVKDVKAGSLYQDRGLGKVANNLGRRAAVGTRGRFGVGATGRAALATATMAGTEETLRDNAQLRELKNYDDANNVMALSGGNEAGAQQAARDLFTDNVGNYDDARAQSALSAAKAVGYSRRNSAAAFQTSSQNKWRAVGAGRYDILQQGINRLAGGNTQEAKNMAYSSQFFNRESGRGDLGGNWITKDTQLRAQQMALDTYGNNDVETEDGRNNVRRSMSDLVALDGMGRTDVSSMAKGFPAQMKQNSDTLQRMLVGGNDAERKLAATRMLELQKALPYASGDNQDTINKMLSDVGVDYDNPAAIDRQLAAIATQSADPNSDPNGLYALSLSRGARTYDQDPALRGQGPQI